MPVINPPVDGSMSSITAQALGASTAEMVELVVDLLTGSAPSADDLYANIVQLSAAIAARVRADMSAGNHGIGCAVAGWQPPKDQQAIAEAASNYLESLMQAVVDRLAIRETLSLECAWQDGC